MLIVADPSPYCVTRRAYELFERQILNLLTAHVDEKLISEQAGFRQGQHVQATLLNLKEHIEYNRQITGAVFVESSSAAYHTINHRCFLCSISVLTTDGPHNTELIRTVPESRRFVVAMNGNRVGGSDRANDYHREVYRHQCWSTCTLSICPYTPKHEV